MAGISPSLLPLFLGEKQEASLREMKNRESRLAALYGWIQTKLVESSPLTYFSGAAAVSLQEFLDVLLQLLNHIKADFFSLEIAVFYIFYRYRDDTLRPVSNDNIYRLLHAATLATIKFYDEQGIYNKQYATLCGLTIQDINKLEFIFLQAIRHQLAVDPDMFFKFLNEVNSNYYAQLNIQEPLKHLAEMTDADPASAETEAVEVIETAEVRDEPVEASARIRFS